MLSGVIEIRFGFDQDGKERVEPKFRAPNGELTPLLGGLGALEIAKYELTGMHMQIKERRERGEI